MSELIETKYNLNLADRANIISAYSENTSKLQLSKQYGISVKGIGGFLKRNNIPFKEYRGCGLGSRKREVNLNAFKEINENSAYWAGFLMADGNIRQGADGYARSIELKLATIDKCHVGKFRDFMGGNCDIKFYQEKMGHGTYRTLIHSKECVKDIAKWGVVPRKTFIAKALNGIEHNLHFWRGVVDGDGSIFFDKKYPAISLVGSIYLITQFKEYISTICPLSQVNLVKNGNIWQIKYKGVKANIIIKHLYSNASIYLDRKYKRAMSILDGKIGFND